MGVAVISTLNGAFCAKTSSLDHCIAEIWHKLVEIDSNCTTINFVHKMGKKFPSVNIFH